MCSGIRLELRGMSDERSVSSALSTPFLNGTYGVNYTPGHEVGASKHHLPALQLYREK